MRIKKGNSEKTVLIISIGFAIIFAITSFRWALYITLGVGILGIVSPKISDLIDSLWMKFARILSYIIPNILLTIIFYLVLFPLAVLSKIFRKGDNLNLRNKNNSLWIAYNKSINKEFFEKTW